MRLHERLCAGFVFLAVAMVAAADPPYVGKWKMNPAKSNFGETTVTYEALPSGEMQATMDGLPYKFRMDGKDYPDAFGNTAAWKELSPTSWQTTVKVKGKVFVTDTVTLSADGKTLTVQSRGTKPNGEPIDTTTVMDRVSGGPGLAGKWKTKNLKSSSPSVLEIAAAGANGIVFKIVDMSLTCDAKLDGKDYPCTGPTLAEGWTVAFTNPDPRSLAMTVKNKGKLLYKMDYRVSPDGKTLAETGAATATNEKILVVYDRQ